MGNQVSSEVSTLNVLDNKSPMSEHAYNSYERTSAHGSVMRRNNMDSYHDAFSTLGRSDMQILNHTIQSRLPDIGGDSMSQVMHAMKSDQDWAETDLLPMGSSNRFNRFATTDLRGDPPTYGEEGENRAHGRTASILFGGSEEFMQRRMADSVAPIPSLHGIHPDAKTVRDSQGFSRIPYY